MPIDPKALRRAFGHFMTGVTVVTAHDDDGNPIGFTANSFTSVSLDPQLLLICIAKTSRNLDLMTKADGFAVNILSEAQRDISNTFARPVENRFATVQWQRVSNGTPILDGVSAWFDCSTYRQVDAGDHIILVGRVEAFHDTDHPGLGYVRGAYLTPVADFEALSANTRNIVVTVLIEQQGKALMIEGEANELCLPCSVSDEGGVNATLHQLTGQTGLKTSNPFIYSVYEDTASGQQTICFMCQALGGSPTKGDFHEIGDDSLARMSDPAMRGIMNRFGQEHEVGSYGIYFGNHASGEVRKVTSIN